MLPKFISDKDFQVKRAEEERYEIFAVNFLALLPKGGVFERFEICSIR